MVREPLFGNSVFVCTKPLQFLVCASIVRSYRIPRSDIYLITSKIAHASDFLAFVRSSSYKNLFSRIHARRTYSEAADAIRRLDYDSLFVDDDRASVYRLFGPLKTRYLVVFEEGFGTYRNDYRAELPPLRRAKWVVLSALTGCGLYKGHGRETNFVMVQFPEVYAALNPQAARKALPLPRLLDEFSHARSDWDRVVKGFAIDVPGNARNCALVLGRWSGSPTKEIREILQSHDLVYYKAHPHASDRSGAEELRELGASWVPVEVFIDYLASRCASLVVYHFASTAYLNCSGHFANVSFVALGEDARVTEVSEKLRARAMNTSINATASPGKFSSMPTKKDQKVAISVVIPTCDRPLMVRRAVRSVLEQSFTPEEIVVVDNGRERLNQLAFPEGVRLLFAPSRAGVSQARNIGAAVCSSELIAFLDDDDYWHCDYLKEIAAAYAAQPAAVLVGSMHDSDTRKPIGRKENRRRKSIASMIRRDPGIIGSTLTIRRETLLALGGFDTLLTRGEDIDFAIRVRRRSGEISYVESAVAYYDYSHEQSRLTADAWHLFSAKCALVSRHISSPPLGALLIVDCGARVAYARIRQSMNRKRSSTAGT